MKVLLPHLPADLIINAHAKAGGNEIETGKFESPESSAALAANVFGYFLSPGRELEFPQTGSLEFITGSVKKAGVESVMRFPWRGGRHPWLDASIETSEWLVGFESKRYEPFRDEKSFSFSDAYGRDKWGANMGPYVDAMNALKAGELSFRFLDAAQLIKHAFGIRTQAEKKSRLRPALVYVYAEPRSYPDGRKPISWADIDSHREEIRRFAELVASAEVRFVALSHSELNLLFSNSPYPALREHAATVREHYLSDQYDP